MQAEVVAFCVAKGWREAPMPFDDAMALLHTEIAESSDAWRRWGTTDATTADDPGSYPGEPHLPKPEGVGSEFADILIRLLDDCEQYNVDLAAEAVAYPGLYGIDVSFLTNMNTLHTMVARATMVHESGDWGEVRGGFTRHPFAVIYVFLMQLCEHYGIDMQSEYDRKMAYNVTCPYKHGNKRA